ncbi:MAG: hypothetical protein ACP5KW_02835 [Thermoproteota archaeon]
MNTKLEGFFIILGIILFVGVILIVGPKFLFDFNVLIYRLLASRLGNLLTAVVQLVFSGVIALLFVYLWRLFFIFVFKYAYSKKVKSTS